MKHMLKSSPGEFEQILAGTRRHELRRNERDFRKGDVLELHEFDPGKGGFTGRVCSVQVTSLTSAEEQCAVSAGSLHPDFCILSIRPVVKTPAEALIPQA